MQSVTVLCWPCSMRSCPDNQLTSVWHSSLLCTLLWFCSKEKQRHLLLFLVNFSFLRVFPVSGIWTKSVPFPSLLLEGILTSVSCLMSQYSSKRCKQYSPILKMLEKGNISLLLNSFYFFIFHISHFSLCVCIYIHTEIWQCYSCIIHCSQII